MKNKYKYTIILFLVALLNYGSLFSQDSALIYLSNKVYSNIDLTIEKYSDNKYVYAAQGKYLDGRRVGIWEFKVDKRDIRYSILIDFLEDSSLVIHPFEFQTGSTIITKDKEVFVIKDDVGNRLRRYCIKGDTCYNCYEYDIKKRVITTYQIIDILKVVNYLNYEMLNISALKEILFISELNKK